MRMRLIASLLVLGAVGVAAGLAACGGSESSGGGSGDTVTIGSIHPLTGPLAADGEQMDEAVKQAVDAINAQGGIEALDGARLEVSAQDSQGKADVGQQAAQQLADEGVAGIIGTFQSDVTTNVATVAARSQVPLVIDVAVADEILDGQNEFVFRIQPNATSMGEFSAESLKSLADEAGEAVQTVAYMHDQSDFGTGVLRGFKSKAADLGIEVTEEIPYDPFNTNDFTTQLTQVKSAAPDVLAVTGYYPDGLKIAQNAAAVKPDVKAIFGVANGAYSLPEFPADGRSAADLVFDSNYHFDATKERVRKIRAEFNERTGQDMRTAAVLSYQAVEVLAQALEDAGSSEPTEVRDAIADVTIDDPLLTFPGPIEFDERGENRNAVPTLMQVQDGEVVQVLPAEVQQAEPRFPGTSWSPD